MAKREPYLYHAERIRCSECNIMITKGGKRKYPQPNFNFDICCEICDLKNPLDRAFRKLNKVMTGSERAAFNDYRTSLFDICKEVIDCDQIKDKSKKFARSLTRELTKISYCEGEQRRTKEERDE